MAHSDTHCGHQCPAFRGISFRDGTGFKSNPGIFRDGISLTFSSRDFLEIVRDFSGLTFFDAISDYLDCILFAKVVPKGWNCLDS